MLSPCVAAILSARHWGSSSAFVTPLAAIASRLATKGTEWTAVDRDAFGVRLSGCSTHVDKAQYQQAEKALAKQTRQRTHVLTRYQ
jgi:hypothetical protein